MREPNARDAAWVLVAALAAMVIAGLLAQAGLPARAVTAILQGAFFGAPLVVARSVGLRPLVASGFVRLSLRQGALVVLASVASLWLMFALARGQTELLRVAGFDRQAHAEEETIRRSLDLRDPFPVHSLAIFALIPPLCEETFFRGILLRGISSRFGLGIALGATSILFSAAHPTLVQRGMMLFLGCYFGVLVHLTGSLWASILAHAVNNVAVVLMIWRFGAELEQMPVPWALVALSALLFCLSMAGLGLERRAPTSASS
ncbi:MAG TPA: CPBP family intramembrane glutamic endopeptidase [Planctomycetota bacterium]|nr:CPBP family intramembrane glutamic endopeptidase [Planctomycetota bacterium]